MKWYDEALTHELRATIEEEILSWYKVTFKKMFGCPCYLANGKMFAGLVTKALVITKLNEAELKEVKKNYQTKPFTVGGKTMKKWVCLLIDPIDLKPVMPFIEKSYQRALKEN